MRSSTWNCTSFKADPFTNSIQSSYSLTFACKQSTDYHQRKSLECSWNAGNEHQCTHAQSRHYARDWPLLLPTTRYHLHQHIILANPRPTKGATATACLSITNCFLRLLPILSSLSPQLSTEYQYALIECAHLSR